MPTPPMFVAPENVRLPAWATRADDGRVLVDPDGIFPFIIEKLGLEKDQFGAAAARGIVTQHLIAMTGGKITIKFIATDGNPWGNSNLPEGRGEHRGEQAVTNLLPKYYQILAVGG